MKGLYGGTFNPIHFGHLNLAIELKEKCNLDEVWVVPAHLSPLRMDEPFTPADHRKKMVELAIADIPGFRLLDLELRRPGPSFTIDTLKELLPKAGEIALLLADDALPDFHRWKDPEGIVRLVPLLIGSRLQELPKDGYRFSSEVARAVEKGRVTTSRMEISATVIRERIKKKLYCGHLLPPKVLDYIYENQLYYSD